MVIVLPPLLCLCFPRLVVLLGWNPKPPMLMDGGPVTNDLDGLEPDCLARLRLERACRNCVSLLMRSIC
jgi:hypothetical protein